MRIARLGLLAGSLTILPVLADSQGEPADTALLSTDKLTVYATRSARDSHRLPLMSNVVDARSAEHASASRVADIFDSLASVEVAGSARRNGQTLVMRGYDSDGVLVLLDGVRQRFESGHDGAFFVDPALLRRVEVIRGASSMLYGSGGLGGVVAMETVDAADLLAAGEQVGGQLAAGYQSVDNERSQTASVFGRTAAMDGLLSVSRRESGDVDLSDGSTLPADDEVLSGLFKLGITLADFHSLKLSAQHYRGDAEEPNNPQLGVGDDHSEELVDKRIDSTLWRLGYRYENPDHEGVNLDAQIYRVDTDLEETLTVATGMGAQGDERRRQLITDGVKLENKQLWQSGDSVTVYGIEAYREEQRGSDSANGEANGIPDAKADFAAVYAQQEWQWQNAAGQWLLLAGARYDRYRSKRQGEGAVSGGAGWPLPFPLPGSASDPDPASSIDASKWSPRFGVSLAPKDWLLLFANYTGAFRAPTMTEIYATGNHFCLNIPGAGGCNRFVPNPDLKPETNLTAELGMGLSFQNVWRAGDALNVKAAYFNVDAEDYIDLEVNFVPPFSGQPCCGTTQSRNISDAVIRGWDATADYRLGPWQLGLSVAYSTGKNSRTDEYLVSNQPRTAAISLAYEVAAINTEIGLRSRFADSTSKVPQDELRRDSYQVHDVYARWSPVDSLTVDLGVNNLTDETYQRPVALTAAPERNLTARVSYQW